MAAFGKRIFILGLINIWRHRLRSTLTILGIVFGVCSVIAMLAIGEGASYEAQEQIRKLGSQNIIIKSVKPPSKETVNVETSFLREYGLTYKDAERIRDTIPAVEVIVPSRNIRANVVYRGKMLDANAIGVVPWYPEISSQKVSAGRFINASEMEDHKNVCVISDDLAKRLFTHQAPLGEVIQVKGDYYKVIGILQKSGATATSQTEGPAPLNLYIPLTAAKSRFGDVIMTRSSGTFSAEKVELHEIIAKVKELGQVMMTSEVIRDTLKRFHKEMDYEVIVPLELLRQAERTKRIFNIVLGSIAAISLLVGGIGIMNIMLASVTERTREIGIRRALGAKRRDIIIQFLTETVLLSGSGGIIGLAIGVLIPYLITRFAEMETIIRAWSLMGAFGISLLIGIVFGMYPAYRAAIMDPITALRHE
ncbi:MAG: ABC transporter permease [Candidatus Omnitrophica bacterium]|nr:ABC transporter permease [bacterium]MBK7495113.1 ABC transporter permease [Candidatus Omnitrophota bacterium]MCE7909450.1 ABC transporter ATP-binding protein [Candidatus Omnitrophica bacterium COP1]MBV6483149.1 putative ABC transporter permease YknZ [bacterium]MCC6731921.1 ABC transporter permease [Candidatus Omnitrophota bacterium]